MLGGACEAELSWVIPGGLFFDGEGRSVGRAVCLAHSRDGVVGKVLVLLVMLKRGRFLVSKRCIELRVRLCGFRMVRFFVLPFFCGVGTSAD